MNLDKLEGRKFDLQYMAAQVSDHQKTAQLLEYEIGSGQNAAIKDLIAGGTLGTIYFISTSRVNLGLHQPDVSVVWDLAPHDFSILRYWLEELPEQGGRDWDAMRQDIRRTVNKFLQQQTGRRPMVVPVIMRI